jgi:hypothetical protein
MTMILFLQAELLEHTKLILMWFCEKIDPQPFPQGRFVRVFDFKGFKMSHARDVGAIRMGMSIIRMIEKYFPERLEKCYVINAPPVLFHLWNSIVKNMLDKKTAEKFCIVKGKNMEECSNIYTMLCQRKNCMSIFRINCCPEGILYLFHSLPIQLSVPTCVTI